MARFAQRIEYTILKFEFENKNLFLTAVGENDSLELSFTEPHNLKDLKIKDLTKNLLWKEYIGKKILFFWLLENNLDHTDGFQIQFGPMDNSTKMIQGLVIASKFHFYFLQQIK